MVRPIRAALTISPQRYFNPKATEGQILQVSHAMVALFAIVMGLLGLIFFYIGISMGWLYVRSGSRALLHDHN